MKEVGGRERTMINEELMISIMGKLVPITTVLQWIIKELERANRRI